MTMRLCVIPFQFATLEYGVCDPMSELRLLSLGRRHTEHGHGSLEGSHGLESPRVSPRRFEW